MAFSLDARGHSETGLVRKNNQDSAYLSPTAIVVADGMGGAAAGDLASSVAITTIAKADGHFEGEEMLEAIGGAVSRANDKLADLVAWDSALEGMGTTVCGGLFDGSQLGMVHIGDSRGYLLRDGELTRLTHDHSWVQSLIDEGKISEEQAATHPHRSLLLRVLNGQPTSAADTELVDLHEGDRLLFCSDGLSGFTTEEEIAGILRDLDLDDAVTALVQGAYAGGGADNITFLLADVVAQSATLDAVEPQILGAAANTPIPDVSDTSRIDLDQVDEDALSDADERPETPKAPAPRRERADAEQLRYLPEGTGRRKRWVSTSLLALVLVLVLGGSALGARSYIHKQYYVGAADQQVAIYNGVQGHVPGVHLNTVYDKTGPKLSDLPVYFQQKVQQTIDADNLQGARETVRQLTAIAKKCTDQRAARASASASASSASAAASSASAASASAASASRASQTASSASRGSSPAHSTSAHSTPSHPSASARPSASATGSSPASSGTPHPTASSTSSGDAEMDCP